MKVIAGFHSIKTGVRGETSKKKKFLEIIPEIIY
jgi:hypothetical protein